MARATWKGALLADSDSVVVVEGETYFPPESIRREHFRESDFQTSCARKGVASYYDVIVGGEVNPNAALYYAEPGDGVKQIAGRIAFRKGVRIET